MFKKLLISTAILAASSSVALAHTSYKGEHDYKGEQPMPVAAAPCPTYTFLAGPYLGLSVGHLVNTAAAPANYHGINGKLSLGYGAVLTPGFYMAGELFTGTSAQLKNNRTAAGQGVKTGWTYGASLIPGFMVTDHVLAYARVGVQRARFSDLSANRGGWHAGLGAQTSLTPNLDIRSEYVYSQYKSTPVGRPLSNEFNVGLVFKFL